MINLDNPIKYLKGVGPKKSLLFNKLNIFTIRDLLTYYPKEWIDRREIKKIAEVRDGEYAVIFGKIELIDVIILNQKLSVFKSAITDQTGVIYAIQYKKHSYSYDVFKKLKTDFKLKNKVLIYGKVTTDFGLKQITIEDYKIIEDDIQENEEFTQIIPVYQLTEGINMKFIRNVVKQAIDEYAKYYPEILTDSIRKKYNLIPIYDAIRNIHFPNDFIQKDLAKRRLSFDELLVLEIAMLISKRQINEKKKNRTYEIKKNLLLPFKENLGFTFTKAQKRVINEIFSDLKKPTPMNRLLLGDVGSGKTVVALSAILLAIENGFQVAFMAPTEILAEQHYYTINNFVDKLNIRIELLTGAISINKKKDIVNRILSGEIDLVIGTHALIEENIKFRNLALIVIDEQHKFGVIQRQKLRNKAFSQLNSSVPDMLIMTATPIPRTFALTLYYDLDISIIDELPPGRSVVHTEHVDENTAYEFTKKEINAGHQAFIVFPLIDDSDILELRSVLKEGKRLIENVFKNYRVGILHGRMRGKQKEKIMIDFRDKKYDILITTTVIEVGIDIPNATVMVIHHADRFGLATLHQLRGRIGRSNYQSTCFILGSPKTEEAKKRFEIFTSTTDGFKIAESDLELRGPGEFFGTAQHGLLKLKISNILTDIEIIELARKCASELLEKDKFLKLPEHYNLRKELLNLYSEKLDLPRTL